MNGEYAPHLCPSDWSSIVVRGTTSVDNSGVATEGGGGASGATLTPTSDRTPHEIDADPSRFSGRKSGVGRSGYKGGAMGAK